MAFSRNAIRKEIWKKLLLLLLLLLPLEKEGCKTFYPMSRIRPVTARPAPQ